MNDKLGDDRRCELAKYQSNWRYLVHRGIQATALTAWLKANFRVSVHGACNLRELPTKGAFVIVSNHASHLDAPLIIGSLPHNLGARVAVGAASDYFFKNYWQSKPTRVLLNTFPIDRYGQKTHRGMAAQLVANGVPILVFPEGTRTRTGELGQFHAGAMRIALDNRVSVLPIALAGTGMAWPVNDKKWQPGRPTVSITFLPPFVPTAAKTAEQWTELARRKIQQSLSAR